MRKDTLFIMLLAALALTLEIFCELSNPLSPQAFEISKQCAVCQNNLDEECFFLVLALTIDLQPQTSSSC